jgi:hypothetical protein
VADEELAPDEGEALELAPDEQQEPEADTPEPIVNLATELGWVPKDQFRGDPDKWKPADQFIRAGRDIQQTTAKELRSLRDQVERMGSVTETIAQDRVAQARVQWEAEMARAVEDGDTAAAMKLARQEPTAKTAGTTPDATVQQWAAKNTWMDTDPLAASVAREVSNRLAAEGYDTAAQLAAAEKEVKRRFPEHFPAATKAPPATQTGAARNPNPSNRVKGFADMPPAIQRVARDQVERHPGLTFEAIAKSYWADPNNQKGA